MYEGQNATSFGKDALFWAVSFRPVITCVTGFSFLGIPECLTPVLSPRVGLSEAFPGSRLLVPSGQAQQQ